MPVPNEYATVVERLRAGIEGRSLVWRATGLEGQYVTTLTDYAVVLSINIFTELFNSDRGIQSPVTVRVMLPQGFTVTSFDIEPNEPAYGRLRAMYDSARGQALTPRQVAEQVADRLANDAGVGLMSKVG